MYIVSDKKDLDHSGIYAIVDSAGYCKYVGQAQCFKTRLRTSVAEGGDFRQ